MPELPDIETYVDHLRRRVNGLPLEHTRVSSPFFVRTFDPPLSATEGRRVERLSRLGKRIVFHLEGDLFVVLHLMIAGRLRWGVRGAPVPRKVGLAAFDFPNGTLVVVESSTKKRASLHAVRGDAGLRALDPGGIEPLQADLTAFRSALTRERHTVKRALTDPHLFSGIGNAYSDEILWRAGLSPVIMTSALTEEQIARLRDATRSTLQEWTARLAAEAGDDFPEKVTAFREGMAVHGRYKLPCPACGSPVQRIAYAANEANYCARCQTGGKLLADRALSRLMRSDFPKTLEELEERIARTRSDAPARGGRQ